MVNDARVRARLRRAKGQPDRWRRGRVVVDPGQFVPPTPADMASVVAAAGESLWRAFEQMVRTFTRIRQQQEERERQKAASSMTADQRPEQSETVLHEMNTSRKLRA